MSFLETYKRDPIPAKQPQDVSRLAPIERGATRMTAFLAEHGGASYSEGMYRIFTVVDMARWTEIALEQFPEFRGRVFCFGADWLGRIFALDFKRLDSSQFLVFMMEPGTGQVLEIPATFMQFHDHELVQRQDAALAASSYKRWLSSGGPQPTFQQCVGYKKPLFLNGEDDAPNLEIVDMEVYWSISAQLWLAVKDLPDGTRIGNIRIEE